MMIYLLETAGDEREPIISFDEPLPQPSRDRPPALNYAGGTGKPSTVRFDGLAPRAGVRDRQGRCPAQVPE